MGVRCAEVVIRCFTQSHLRDRVSLWSSSFTDWLVGQPADSRDPSTFHFPELGLQTYNALLIFLYEFWGIQTRLHSWVTNTLPIKPFLQAPSNLLDIYTTSVFIACTLLNCKTLDLILLLNTNTASIAWLLLSPLPCAWLVFIWQASEWNMWIIFV